MRFICLLLFARGIATSHVQAAHPYQFLYPIHNTNNHNTETVVIIRPGQEIWASQQELIANNATIHSHTAGNLSFHAVALDNHRVLTLRPVDPFNYNDTITVSLPGGILKDTTGNWIPAYQFKFVVRSVPSYYFMQPDEEDAFVGGSGVIEYETLGETAPGYIFHTAFEGFNGLNIVTNNGNPIYTLGGVTWDLKTQLDNKVLSFYSDMGGFEVRDTAYQRIKIYACAMGVFTDFHDFVLLPNGNGLLFGHDQIVYNMSTLVAGGHPEAQIDAAMIQEIDSLTGLPIFVWRSIDYMLPTDAINSNSGGVNFMATHFDMTHANAIDIGADGNIIMSMRDMNEVTKINRLTGEIIWRLGGRHSSFSFVNDPDNGFNMQHCVKWVPGSNNQISMLDNGVFRTNSNPSAAKIYQLDETNMTATLVRSYYNPQNRTSQIMGSVQMLPSNHLLIGWGENDGFYAADPIMAVEIDSTNQVVWQMKNVGNTFPAYRVFRHNWKNSFSNVHQLHTRGSLQVQVIQNPTNDYIRFQLSDVTNIRQAQVHIYTTDGQLVYSTEVPINNKNHTIQIHCTDWKSGSYTYVIRTATSVRSGIVQVFK